LTDLVELRLEDRTFILVKNEATTAVARALAGCSVAVSDVPKQKITSTTYSKSISLSLCNRIYAYCKRPRTGGEGFCAIIEIMKK
jgi:hypothetical protein